MKFVTEPSRIKPKREIPIIRFSLFLILRFLNQFFIPRGIDNNL